ncbi:hypothetical protein EBZ39_05970 [bacterium]|nr:hypothetical protein [bacterium]
MFNNLIRHEAGQGGGKLRKFRIQPVHLLGSHFIFEVDDSRQYRWPDDGLSNVLLQHLLTLGRDVIVYGFFGFGGEECLFLLQTQ